MDRNGHFLLRALEETLRFVYQSGDVTPLGYPHATGWRTLPWAVTVQAVGARVCVERDDSKQIVGDGEAFVIPAGIRHNVDKITVPPSLSRWSHVNFTLFGSVDLFSLLEIPPVLCGTKASEIGEINAALAALNNVAASTVGQVLRKQSLGLRLAAVIADECAMKARAEIFLDGAARLAPVLRHVQGNLGQPLGREELARLAHLSPSRFFTVFKETLGICPSAYVQRLRMQQAQQRLINTEQGVAEIGMAVGYDDPFHFSRLFKKHYGISPSRYRIQVKREQI
jgi:AraC-like DNA-binding protein